MKYDGYATGWTIWEGRDWDPIPGRVRDFSSSPQRNQTGSGAHLVASYSMGIWSLRPGYEADHSHLQSSSRIFMLGRYLWNADREGRVFACQGWRILLSPSLFLRSFTASSPHKFQDMGTGLYLVQRLTFKRRIKSHLPFAGIIKSSPYSPRFQDNG